MPVHEDRIRIVGRDATPQERVILACGPNVDGQTLVPGAVLPTASWRPLGVLRGAFQCNSSPFSGDELLNACPERGAGSRTSRELLNEERVAADRALMAARARCA